MTARRQRRYAMVRMSARPEPRQRKQRARSKWERCSTQREIVQSGKMRRAMIPEPAQREQAEGMGTGAVEDAARWWGVKAARTRSGILIGPVQLAALHGGVGNDHCTAKPQPAIIARIKPRTSDNLAISVGMNFGALRLSLAED